MDKLFKLLLERHCMDEHKQAVEDIDFRNQLYEEYNLCILNKNHTLEGRHFVCISSIYCCPFLVSSDLNTGIIQLKRFYKDWIRVIGRSKETASHLSVT